VTGLRRSRAPSVLLRRRSSCAARHPAPPVAPRTGPIRPPAERCGCQAAM